MPATIRFKKIDDTTPAPANGDRLQIGVDIFELVQDDFVLTCMIAEDTKDFVDWDNSYLVLESGEPPRNPPCSGTVVLANPGAPGFDMKAYEKAVFEASARAAMARHELDDPVTLYIAGTVVDGAKCLNALRDLRAADDASELGDMYSGYYWEDREYWWDESRTIPKLWRATRLELLLHWIQEDAYQEEEEARAAAREIIALDPSLSDLSFLREYLQDKESD